jgi:hypothetical protein
MPGQILSPTLLIAWSKTGEVHVVDGSLWGATPRMVDMWHNDDLYMVACSPWAIRAKGGEDPLVSSANLRIGCVCKTYENKKHLATVMHSWCDVPVNKHICQSSAFDGSPPVYVVIGLEIGGGAEAIYNVAATKKDAEYAASVCVGLWPRVVVTSTHM